jgi:hypothetical protein
MPRLMIRGIEENKVCTISTSLVEGLSKICECGKGSFTIEIIESRGVCDGMGFDSAPFIEVAWFDRGQETRDRFAEELTRQLAGVGVDKTEIAFILYRKDSYYIDGKVLS